MRRKCYQANRSRMEGNMAGIPLLQRKYGCALMGPEEMRLCFLGTGGNMAGGSTAAQIPESPFCGTGFCGPGLQGFAKKSKKKPAT